MNEDEKMHPGQVDALLAAEQSLVDAYKMISYDKRAPLVAQHRVGQISAALAVVRAVIGDSWRTRTPISTDLPPPRE